MYNYVHTYQQNPRNSQGQLGNPGFSNKTQGLATLTKIFFGNHPTEELCFETPATINHFDFEKRNKHQPKQDEILRQSTCV